MWSHPSSPGRPPSPVRLSATKPVTSRVAPKALARPTRSLITPTVRQAATSAPPTAVPVASAPTQTAETYGCGAALSYLATHAAPGFRFECPGYALGHQAMTCINVAGVCPESHLIVIDVPCSAAYMNEASNSWVLEGLHQAPIDPYGYCH